MNTLLRQVSTYMKQVAMPVHVTPVDTIPLADLALRNKFSEKALDDFQDCFTKSTLELASVDKTRALIGLSTRLYSVLTEAHTLGLAYLLPVAFQLLHESLLTTLWTDKEIEGLSHNQYTIRKALDNPMVGDRIWCVTDYRGKIIKSPSYTPPPIADMFVELAGQTLLDFNHARELFCAEDSDLETEPLETCTLPTIDNSLETIWAEAAAQS